MILSLNLGANAMKTLTYDLNNKQYVILDEETVVEDGIIPKQYRGDTRKATDARQHYVGTRLTVKETEMNIAEANYPKIYGELVMQDVVNVYHTAVITAADACTAVAQAAGRAKEAFLAGIKRARTNVRDFANKMDKGIKDMGAKLAEVVVLATMYAITFTVCAVLLWEAFAIPLVITATACAVIVLWTQVRGLGQAILDFTGITTLVWLIKRA